MPVRFLISTLKPGVDPAEYEQWVRERDYALVRTLPNAGAADAGWQYIERIEVKSLEQHDRDLASPAGVALREELYGRFLDRSRNIYFATDAIE